MSCSLRLRVVQGTVDMSLLLLLVQLRPLEALEVRMMLHQETKKLVIDNLRGVRKSRHLKKTNQRNISHNNKDPLSPNSIYNSQLP